MIFWLHFCYRFDNIKPVNVISKSGLLKLTAKCEGSEKDAMDWYRVAAKANWTCFADVRQSFSDADMIGEVLVFNLAHTRYRLITTVFFATRELYVKAVLTHKEYDREGWKKWC
jgi:mRNA interferase HigB